jgi:hypothetical protein
MRIAIALRALHNGFLNCLYNDIQAVVAPNALCKGSSLQYSVNPAVSAPF